MRQMHKTPSPILPRKRGRQEGVPAANHCVTSANHRAATFIITLVR